MGTGWASAAGAQSIAQDSGDITNLLTARLMAQKLAWAQQNAQAMDVAGALKGDAARLKGQQDDFIARRKAMDPTEDRIQKRTEHDADMLFKRDQEQRLGAADAETGRHNLAEETNVGAKLQADIEQFKQGMGLKQAEFGETKRSNLADEALKGRQIDVTLQGKTMKPATPAERQSLAYFNRAQDAVKTLTDTPADKPWGSLEMRIAKQGAASQMQGQYAPNMLQTSEQQAYRQAQRAFTEARLRKESGAAIPVQEFENDARTYFARAGDSAQMIAQKQKSRAALLAGMKFAAGKAYGEFYGGDEGGGGGSPAPAVAPPPPGSPAAKPSGIKSVTLVNP